VGKVVVSFLFFLGSSAVAVREARMPPRVEAPSAPVRVAERVNVPEMPDPTRFARPFYIRPIAPPPPPLPLPLPPAPRVIVIEPTTIEIVNGDNDSSGDVPDNVDRCPLVEDGRYLTDEDGCPEAVHEVVEQTRRPVRVDIID
jgi:hypothetical protein